MSIYPAYVPRRAGESRGNYGDYRADPTAYYSSTTTINGMSFYSPPEPVTLQSTTAPTYAMPNSQQDVDLWHLPPPEEGSRPPAGWDEWEKNSNWPFPANQPKQPLRKAAPNTPAQQAELELNANWPHPPQQARKRTSSRSAPRPRALSSSKPTERIEVKANSNWPLPASAPKESAKPVIPIYASQRNARDLPDSSAVKINPLLARDLSSLIRFDLRLPYTTVRKLVRGSHWTHLNHEDLRQPACTPSRTQMCIYTQLAGCTDWIVNVRPRARAYVTVGDVLMAICNQFNVPIDNPRWARDSVNPTLADRVMRAYRRRVEKIESARTVGYEKARQTGLLRVDYLGSQYCFAGLARAYGGNGSEWWMMDVAPEARR